MCPLHEVCLHDLPNCTGSYPDVSVSFSVTPPELTRFISVQQIQGQTGNDVKLAAVIIIPMINNINAFIFYFLCSLLITVIYARCRLSEDTDDCLILRKTWISFYDFLETCGKVPQHKESEEYFSLGYQHSLSDEVSYSSF